MYGVGASTLALAGLDARVGLGAPDAFDARAALDGLGARSAASSTSVLAHRQTTGRRE
jgi:hypothetical protein